MAAKKKTNPFGDKQAKPFGKKDDGKKSGDKKPNPFAKKTDKK